MADIGLVDADNPVLKQIDDAATRYGVDRNLAHVVAQMESSYNPKADSGKAQGVMQLAPATANTLGVRNAFDSAQNIDGGVRLLSSLLRKYGGDTTRVLAAYNAGEPAVDRANGVPNFPETQNYVKKGMSILYPRPAPAATAATDIGLEDAPPPAAPPASTLDEAKRLGGIAAGASGLTTAKDVLAGGSKAVMDFLTGNPVNPQDVQQFKSGTGAILGGIAGEPERMRQELIKSGDAMTRGDINEAANHLWYSIPFAGGAGAGMAEYLKRGDVKGALAHFFGSLIPVAAEPTLAATGRAIEAAPEAISRTVQAAGAGVRAAAPDVALGSGKIAVATGASYLPIPGPVKYGLGVPTAAAGVKQIVTGLKAGLAAAREATAADLPVPPEVGITPEVLPNVRGLPAPAIVTPAPADTSFVRAVPAQYPEVEPGFQPPAAAAPVAPVAPALSFDDLARSLTGGKNPSKLTVAERANVQNIYDRITKGIQPEDVPPRQPPTTPPAAPPAAPAAPEAPAAVQEPAAGPTAPAAPETLQPAASVEKLTDYVLGKKIAPHLIDQLPPEYWQWIAERAGTRVPTPDQIAQIKQNVAARAVETPAQGEQVFQTQKARIEEGMTPPAAPPAGVVLQPLPGEIPAHYQRIQQVEGTTAATRAFLKDQRIADYLLGKGITPEEFEAMPLEQQNKLVVEAPAASKKGKHLPFQPKPEGAAPRAVGRYAEEGIKDIADTMRWRQAQQPAAPHP